MKTINSSYIIRNHIQDDISIQEKSAKISSFILAYKYMYVCMYVCMYVQYVYSYYVCMETVPKI